MLADHERTVHLGERECSIQRRHQKLVEEAPSPRGHDRAPGVDGRGRGLRGRSGGYRVPAPASSSWRADRSFYFLEMNTRIQVEHPVTELVYGVDLVREQLRIAAGESMRVHQGWLHPRGLGHRVPDHE